MLWPRPWDLVLGGQSQAGIPAHALVLGGLAGAKRRLDSPNRAARSEGIRLALDCGPDGIEVLIESLQTNSEWTLRLAIWKALSQEPDPRAQWATRHLSPFRDVGGSAGVRVAYRRGERDFSYAELAEVDFSQASLGGCLLLAANLKGAMIRGANLNGIQMIETDLRGADLRGSKLSGGRLERADLRGANLQDCKLSGTSLRGAIVDQTTRWDPKAELIWRLQNDQDLPDSLAQADLNKADLRAIKLSDIDLSGANLVGVDWRGSEITQANLSQTNLTRADLRGANLAGSNLSGAILFKADLSQAQLIRVDLTKADLTKANLSGANLTGATLEGSLRSETQVEAVTFADGRRIRPWWW